MAIIPHHPHKRGITLLVSIVFMAVVLAVALALGSIAYKQQTLASDARDSIYAFYAADIGLECALYADQQQNLFAYPASAPASPPFFTCGNAAPVSSPPPFTYTANLLTFTNRYALDSNTHCVDVTVYKYSAPQAPNGLTTYLFSQGYNVSCDSLNASTPPRTVSRGISIHY